MTKSATLTMDSFELAPYAVSVPCFVCDGGNNFDAERCRHCGAPVALTYHAEKHRRRKPQLVAVLGPSGAGKSTYLGMLADMLLRQASDFDVVARGAFSVGLQQEAMSALAKRQFPKATSAEPEEAHWFHCEVNSAQRRRPLDLVVPDLAGALLEDEVDHAGSHKAMHVFLMRCAAAVILVDASDLAAGNQQPDFDAMKALTYLSELDTPRRQPWTSRPIAVVITKAGCDEACFDDPAQYCATNAPGLWKVCHRQFSQHAFFATSVVGATVSGSVAGQSVVMPLRIEPRGILAPLAWLVSRLP